MDSTKGESVVEAKRAQTDRARLSHLMAGTQLEDAGLHSYRSFHLMAQSILVAVGAILCTKIPESSTPSAVAIAFFGFFAVAVHSWVVMRRIIRRRQEEVNWWLDEMQKVERGLAEEDQFWTRYRAELYSRFPHSIRVDLAKLDWWLLSIWVLLFILTMIFLFNGLGFAGSPPMSLNTSQTVFMLFFAIFWGAIANVQPRWKAFQFPLLRTVKPQVKKRCALAIVLLNLAPLGYFLLIMWILGKVSSGATVWHHLLVGISPAFGVFGLYRFWLGKIESSPGTYYKSKRVADGHADAATDGLEEKFWHVEPIYRQKFSKPSDPPKPEEDSSLPVIDIGIDRGRANLYAGILYLVFVAIVLLVFWPR